MRLGAASPCLRTVAAAALVCAVAGTAGAATPAQSVSYSRRVWQSPDGLPEDFAQAIAQTADGYLWIGTSGGLVRFDGVRFAVFNSANAPAFRDDSVYTLFTSADGTLWAGTEGGGLIRYRDGVFDSFGTAHGLTNLFVRVVFEDRERRVWVGTDDGLFLMDGSMLRRVDSHDGIPRLSVHAICQDREGRLLIGGSGLLVLNDGRATHYRSSEAQADNSIRTIRQSRDGAIWIGTISGLRRLAGGLRGDPFAVRRILDGVNISFIRETRAGQMWVGTYGRGVVRFDDTGMASLTAPADLPHDNVLALFEDAEENVWVGTQGGLLRLAPSVASTVTTTDGAPISINTIYEDPRGLLLVAALNGRLFRLTPHVLVPADLPPAVAALPIRNAFRDRGDRLWLGTDGRGVARLDGTNVVRLTTKEGLVSDFVRAFCEDLDGGIWIGTDGGLSYWRDGKFRNFAVGSGLTYASIRALRTDRSGHLWIATERGVSKYRAGRFERVPLLDRVDGHKVWALHEDSDGGLWMGTQGAGLFLMKNGRLEQFTTEHGLPSNKIHFIGEDGRGTLWMSGPSGVVAVSRHDLEGLHHTPATHVAIRVYGTAEGLVTNQMTGGVQPAGAITASGDIWLPSAKGVVRIVSDRPSEPRALPLVIEQVIADGRAVSTGGPLQVPPGEGKLEIHYTSTRLRAPERLRFKYWMEGFERDWTAAGQRRVAYYTNLPAGEYRFHVVAYEIDAPQNTTEQMLAIRLRPHFYQTRWFLAVCVLAVGLIGWAGYRHRLRTIRRQFAAVLEERNRVAREMHDTLLQGCVGVSTLLEAASHAEEVSPSLSRQLLTRAQREVRAAVEEARLAIWDLRHGSRSGDDLVPAIADMTGRVSLDTGVRVRFDVVGAPVPVGSATERSLKMLIREALQNAIRHGAPQTLSVVLRFDPHSVHIEIADDGCGFDATTMSADDSHHYGLLGMRERVEQAGGEFHLTSEAGKGTQVRLTIPVSA